MTPSSGMWIPCGSVGDCICYFAVLPFSHFSRYAICGLCLRRHSGQSSSSSSHHHPLQNPLLLSPHVPLTISKIVNYFWIYFTSPSHKRSQKNSFFSFFSFPPPSPKVVLPTFTHLSVSCTSPFGLWGFVMFQVLYTERYNNVTSSNNSNWLRRKLLGQVGQYLSPPPDPYPDPDNSFPLPPTPSPLGHKCLTTNI